MSFRFAASRQGDDAILARALTCVMPTRVANDNGRPLSDIMADPQMLRASLLHFAKYGLQAAEQARENALVALREGDETEFRHWLAVCRQLDRRMARGLEDHSSPLVG